MVTKDGKPWMCYGVMGGEMQPQGHVQALVNMIDFGMDAQAAGDAGRVRHDGSQTPTGRPMAAEGGTLDIESSIPEATVTELVRRGHRVLRKGGDTFGGYQGIRIDEEHGTLQGGSEPRKDGAAVGY
jgi:gamma-glutamyltranspeptidase/glutathione hydrolase